MQLIVTRYSIKIVPENPVDVAYLEEVLGFHYTTDTCPVQRVNRQGLTNLAYIRLGRGGDYDEPT